LGLSNIPNYLMKRGKKHRLCAPLRTYSTAAPGTAHVAPLMANLSTSPPMCHKAHKVARPYFRAPTNPPTQGLYVAHI